MYYGPAQMLDNPCTTGSDSANQAGLLRYATDADPDGAGPVWAIRHEYVYDALGRTVAHRVRGNDGVLGGWECTTYDARGRVVATTDRTGVAATVDYTTPGVVIANYTDSAGTPRTTRRDADLLGRTIASVDEFDATFTQTYDQAGRAVEGTRRLPGEPSARLLVRNLYHPANSRLTSIEDHAAAPVAVSTVGYDSAGRPNTTTAPNGVVSTTTFDANTGLATSVTHARVGATLAAATVTRAGQVVSKATG